MTVLGVLPQVAERLAHLGEAGLEGLEKGFGVGPFLPKGEAVAAQHRQRCQSDLWHALSLARSATPLVLPGTKLTE